MNMFALFACRSPTFVRAGSVKCLSPRRRGAGTYYGWEDGYLPYFISEQCLSPRRRGAGAEPALTKVGGRQLLWWQVFCNHSESSF